MDDMEVSNNRDNDANLADDAKNSDSLKASPFYTESVKKTGGRKRNSIVQLILVAVISSILGGFAFGAFFLFVAPSVQPSVKDYFDKMIPGYKTTADSTSVQSSLAAQYKKVEIVQQSDSQVAVIAEKVGPSVVGVRVTAKVQDFFFGEQEGTGEGSGIIIRSDGYVMTNFHVIQNALNGTKMDSNAKIEIFLPNQKDKAYPAKIVGYDSRTDLAVLKIDVKNLPAAELGNSDNLKVGELAVAIGNPGGLEFMGSVTVGVVSGLNRTIPVEDSKQLKLIQTDAAINPGNSGGALVNSKGQVIGINSAKLVAQGYEGLGFAIPINTAKQITDSLITSGYVKGRPILGIKPDTTFTEDAVKQYNARYSKKIPAGVLVADVDPLSGAYKAGIQRGDIITKFDGKAVKTRSDLDTLRDTHKVGDTVTVEVYREDKYMTFKVVLSEDTGAY